MDGRTAALPVLPRHYTYLRGYRHARTPHLHGYALPACLLGSTVVTTCCATPPHRVGCWFAFLYAYVLPRALFHTAFPTTLATRTAPGHTYCRTTLPRFRRHCRRDVPYHAVRAYLNGEFFTPHTTHVYHTLFRHATDLQPTCRRVEWFTHAAADGERRIRVHLRTVHEHRVLTPRLRAATRGPLHMLTHTP